MKKIMMSVSEWKQISETLEDEKIEVPVWFTVTGSSMLPFIRANRDRVLLVPINDTLRTGDIVLFRTSYKTGRCCLHRVYKINDDTVQTFGDGNMWPDKPVSKDRILGKAILINRGERKIDCESLWWRFIFRIWATLWPIRTVLLKIAKVLKSRARG